MLPKNTAWPIKSCHLDLTKQLCTTILLDNYKLCNELHLIFLNRYVERHIPQSWKSGPCRITETTKTEFCLMHYKLSNVLSKTGRIVETHRLQGKIETEQQCSFKKTANHWDYLKRGLFNFLGSIKTGLWRNGRRSCGDWWVDQGDKVKWCTHHVYAWASAMIWHYCCWSRWGGRSSCGQMSPDLLRSRVIGASR